jgi:hypothetical protein
MTRYAMIVTATGAVDNVVEYDGVSPFTPPTGIELREADANAEPGGTWDGSEFIRAVVPDETRTEVLMGEVNNPKKPFDYLKGESVDKTAETVAAEKAEILALLTAKLADSAQELTQREVNLLLRLERGL